ncbi:Myb-like protein J [Phytophthora citrophthora]|uniref:Myb-like protein J n=1 Tax=Phytophthora citrophthora TaxID=4793 RepID=A0AAD9G951_9STRA|nr:Myb-like protein J [Phytophthora citrophthora]
MTITKRVQKELVQSVPPADNQLLQTLRKNSRTLRATQRARSAAEKNKGKAWTREEHARFLVALDVFPSGPWKAIADYVGTKDSRQTMTHAQKYRQKHERQQRGLRNRNKTKKTVQQPETPVVTTSESSDEAEPEMIDVATHEDASPTVDVIMTEVMDFSVFPETPTLVKQLSDSPRSADDGAQAVQSDPFTLVAADDSLFSLALDAGAAWLNAKNDSNLMEIFTDYNEPATESEWPQTWSTNSLEEIVTSCAQFDFLGETAH